MIEIGVNLIKILIIMMFLSKSIRNFKGVNLQRFDLCLIMKCCYLTENADKNVFL